MKVAALDYTHRENALATEGPPASDKELYSSLYRPARWAWAAMAALMSSASAKAARP